MITEKRIVSVLLGFALMAILSMLMTENVWAAGISYVERSWNGNKVTAETKSCTSYSKVADVSGSKELSASWYVADTNQTFGSSDRLEVKADTVNLIIRNGVTLTCQDGIHVPAGKTLNIYFEYGVPKGYERYVKAETGKLIALGDTNDMAAIGGNDGESGGNITIHGGYVKADGYNNNKGEDAAGIGGGNKGSGGTVTIYGGTVEAAGSNYGAGIGSGDADKNGVHGGTVKIYGGNVTAKGGCDGAGIGGGEGASGATVDIYDGTVNATGGTTDSSDSGAGIGSGDKDGYSVNAGTVRIHEGNVTAQGGPYGAGIGGGNEVHGGTVEITGGTVKATGGKRGAGIGGGYEGNGGNVTAKFSVVTATGGEGAMGFGRGKDGNNNGPLSLGEYVNLYGGGSEDPTGKVPASSRYQYMIARFERLYEFKTQKFCLVNPRTGYIGGLRYADVILKTGGREVGRIRINEPYKTAENRFTITATNYADSITTEFHTVLGNISASNVYGSASGDLTSPGSLRAWRVFGEFTFTFDYTVNDLPAPVYQEPVAKSGLTYTGEAQALIDGGSVKTGGVMQYALGSNSSEVPTSGWDTKLPAAKDPGEYYVWYRITSGKGRGEEAKCLPAIKINKAKLTITALDRGVTLYHAAPDLSKPIENKHYIITGLIGEDKLKTEPKLEYQKNGAAVQPDTSWFATYDIVPYGAEADKYDISYENGSLTVKPMKRKNVAYEQGYWDSGKGKVVYTNKFAYCQRLDEESASSLSESWYYVEGEPDLEGIKPVVAAKTVNIVLINGSKLKCEDGIYVPEGHSLNIYAQSNFANTRGKLQAYGDGNGSAGIGGIAGKPCGDIFIYGGEITAKGDPNAAGIGGGDGAAGGKITFYGGYINARGGSGGAGVGGGNNARGGNITVQGGQLISSGGTDAAGIGGGNGSDGGNIEIYAGIVKGVGGQNAAGVGGGNNAAGGNVAIKGGTTYGTGGSGKDSGGAGIGGGAGGNAGNITISGGKVETVSGMDAASIGGGDEGKGGTIVISGGEIKTNNSYNGAGIGSGSNGSFGKIEISGGKVEANGGEYAAGIGAGRNSEGRKSGTIKISRGEITSRGGAGGAGIGGGEDVKISISGGTIRAYGGTNGTTGGAGIGGANATSGGEIKISENAYIKEARGGQNAAGIGGGSGADGGDIRIYNATISAAGSGNGAGIGGGERGQGGSVTIKDGYMHTEGAGGGAGIGGGRKAASGSIRVYGGTVKASGGDRGGAGIGTGALCDQNACNVAISGGTVTAHGGAGYTEINNAIGDGVKFHTYEGAGVGAGGAQTRANRISGPEDEWDEEAVVEHAYFNGRISITGGTVSVDLMGSSRDDALEGNKPGTIEFGGGTVNVRNTPVRAGRIEFADNVRVKGATADKREKRCKEGEALTVEVCPHDNLDYKEIDESSHSVECRECMTSLGKTEEHAYGEPVWNWDKSGTAASATFTCVKCGHTDVREADQVNTEPEQTGPQQNGEGGLKSAARNASTKSVKYGAVVAMVKFEGKTYTDEKDRTEYSIEVESCENGSVDVPESADAGDEVNVLVKPDEHYHVSSVTVNGEALTVSEGSCTFKMPKGNVKVSAVFEIDTVKLTWISRDFVYDYEKDEYTDETVDTVVYEEEVPYGTESPLPSAEEFAALYGYCGLDKWEVEKNGKTVEMKPGESAVADSDVALTAIWREHDFRYSISEDGATITASCSHEDCALTDGKISLTIRRPAVNTYGDTEKGLEANASLTLDGLDAFIKYARNLQAFMEYGEGMDASEEYAEITEYYKAHPDEYAEYAEEIDAYLKDLEDCAAVIDGWADKYIKYYRAEKDSEGVYVKTGSALEAAPTEAGDYVAELVADPGLFGSDTKIFVGYTIGKADPLYEVPENLSAEFGDKLSGVKFSKTADGEWSWNDEETKVSKLDVYKGMATFTPEDQKNYNTLTYVRVPVKVTTTTETNIADRALVDAAYDAVDAFRKKQSRANINAAQAALAKIRTNNQKMMYGPSRLANDVSAVEDAQKKLANDVSAVEDAQKKLVKTVTINTKTVTAKKVKAAIAKAGGDSKYVTTIILGKKVAKIGKSTFKSCKKVKTLTVKTKKLKKKSVKGSLKGSKITKIKVKIGKKKTNKKYVKKYKKIFKKKNSGKKVKVTL